MLRQRPVNLEQIEKHRKRARIPSFGQTRTDVNLVNSARPALFQTWFPSLPLRETRVLEKLFHDAEMLIKSSFETHRWKFHTNELIIVSSSNQKVEKINLQEFVAECDSAIAAADVQQFVKAGLLWQHAFSRVKRLVEAEYHDVIPNVLQKINDLNNCGYRKVASLLKNHVADIARTTRTSTTFQTDVLVGLGTLDLDQFGGLEAGIMEQFNTLFHFYLGAVCYNSFVMTMNAARRRLLRDRWSACDDFIPGLCHLDIVFGPSNRRSMDVISLRAEIMYRRHQFMEVEAEARMLVQRADTIVYDEWQRCYYLTRGYYFLGCSQFHRDDIRAAEESFANTLLADQQLCLINDFSIFNAEKTAIKRYLEAMHSRKVNEELVIPLCV